MQTASLRLCTEDSVLHLAPRKRTLTEEAHPPFCAGRKLSDIDKALLWNVLHEDPECPTRVLLDKVVHRQRAMAVSVRPLNRWRAPWQRHRRKGRPRPGACSTAAGGALVQVTPHLSGAGVHLFAHGLAQPQTFEPVGARLPQAIAAHQHAHPADDFARLPHRDQTLRRRFEALCFAPLWGIERLTACDTPAHPLQTRLGRGDHSTTRRQFLGQRDRIDAATALRPALVPDKARQITYVDGPMIASWSRASMPKGPSTMLGRIRAGSHAVIAHHEAGHALFVQYDPPALQGSHVSVASCQQVALATGTALFVSDRAINAVAMAWACAAQGLGVLAMLDDNAPQGLESFAAMLGGTLEEGPKG